MTTPKPALPEPVPPNAEGSTTCIVRWMVTTRDGLWLGAWDKEAFAAYTQFAIDAAVAEARAVPDGRNVCKVDPGFRWDGDAQQHVPQVLVEFAPVPANALNDSPGWLARDAFVAALAATPSPAEQPKPAVRAEKLYDAIKEVLLHHRLSYTEGEDAEAFPLVDMLCPPGSRDISKGRDEITLICDAIYNDEAVRAAISGEQP